jgi:tetratricopeptide (TPR) repeat protein
MKYLYFILIFLIPLFSFASNPDSVSIYMAQGDTSYSNFNHEAALENYQSAFKLSPQNYEAAWKICRAYVDLGEIKTNKKDRKLFFQNGLDFANKAVEINPEGSKGYLWQSIALGRVALDAGKKEQVRLSKEVKASVEKALELNPNDDFAWHVLGRWHRKMATLGWIQRQFANLFLGGIPKDASVEESANCFKKAIEINPDHINHHLELAITYEKLKEKELAIEEYEKVVNLPKKDSDDESHKIEAKKRIEKLK